MTDEQKRLIGELLLAPCDGATAGAILALVDENHRMRRLLGRAVADGIDDGWLAEARAVLGPSGTTAGGG